jgi:hypothetical protein
VTASKDLVALVKTHVCLLVDASRPQTPVSDPHLLSPIIMLCHLLLTSTNTEWIITMMILNNTSLTKMVSALPILLISELLLLPICIQASAPHKPNTIVAEWVRAKLGSPPSSAASDPTNNDKLWMYKGSLYDPLDGRKIANVQGLECISLWNNATNTTSALQVESLLENPNATYDGAATLRITKVFCYTTLNDENPQLLRQIRVRPNSPRKEIPLEQTVALWETATTYLSRGTEFYVHSEWPNGQHLWGQTTTSSTRNTMKNKNREFTIFTKRRSPKSRLYLPDLTTKTAPKTANNESTIISPQRSALIQFGSSAMETQNKFGARETYSLSSAPATEEKAPNPWWRRRRQASTTESRLKYTRYGEGPPFYAPGRMCMLELQGRPIDTLQEASSLLQQLVQDRVENFPSLPSSSSFGSVRLIPERVIPDTRWGRYKQATLQAWDRLRAATSFQC